MKLDDGKLIHCASCNRQDLDLRHIDFEAYYDGPMVDEETYRYQVTDLIICENCLKEASHILGYVQADDIKQENAELGEALEARVAEIEKLHELVSDLEKTVEHLADKKIQRPARKPKIVEAVS